MSARDETYNYPRFKMSNYELGYFPGPKAGEVIDYDYKLTDLDGNEVELSDYKGKWLVIESGSLTCPMYVKNVKPFANVVKLLFVFKTAEQVEKNCKWLKKIKDVFESLAKDGF